MEPSSHPDGTPDVGCTDARELISAAADDQLGGADVAILRSHLAGCDGCSVHADRVASLTRAVRLRSASVDVAFVNRVMERARPARLGRGGWLRPALAWCGLLLVVESVRPLMFGEIDGAPTHVARHLGASTLALAIGLLYVAARPHRAAGLLPFVVALFVALLTGALFDTIGGGRSPFAELIHVVELTGMILLWLIAGSPGWDRVERLTRRATRSVRTGRPASARSTS